MLQLLDSHRIYYYFIFANNFLIFTTYMSQFDLCSGRGGGNSCEGHT